MHDEVSTRMRISVAVVAAMLTGFVVTAALWFVLGRGRRLTVFLSSEESFPTAWDVMDKRPIVAGAVAAVVVGIATRRMLGQRRTGRAPDVEG